MLSERGNKYKAQDGAGETLTPVQHEVPQNVIQPLMGQKDAKSTDTQVFALGATRQPDVQFSMEPGDARMLLRPLHIARSTYRSFTSVADREGHSIAVTAGRLISLVRVYFC